MLCFHQLRLLAALVEPLACLSFQDPCSRHWCIALDDNDNGDDGDEEEEDKTMMMNNVSVSLPWLTLQKLFLRHLFPLFPELVYQIMMFSQFDFEFSINIRSHLFILINLSECIVVGNGIRLEYEFL